MKEFTITKRDAVALFRTQAGLARALGITGGAVWHWHDDKPIPDRHALRIRYILRPECFTKRKN